MFDDGVEFSFADAVGQANGENHVIKGGGGREVGTDDAAIDLSDNIIGFNADLVEHGTEQRGLVFAIAVLVLENRGGRMSLNSANADFNSHVANLALHKIGESFDLIESGRQICGKLDDFLFDLGGSLPAVDVEAGVPESDVFPGAAGADRAGA